MSSFTENYDLIKPSSEDYYDVQDFNENMDAIDAQLAQTETRLSAVDAQLTEAESALAAISKKIGAAGDTGSTTLFGLLGNTSASPIKSIQYVRYTAAADTASGNVAISTVDPEKCIVLFERLKDNYAEKKLYGINYTLTASALTFTHDAKAGSIWRDNLFGFYIVEFY